MINRAVKSTDKEINANQKQISQLITAVKKVKSVSDLYAKKMDKIGEGLSGEYKTKSRMARFKLRILKIQTFRTPSKTMKNGMTNFRTARKRWTNTMIPYRNAGMPSAAFTNSSVI